MHTLSGVLAALAALVLWATPQGPAAAQDGCVIDRTIGDAATLLRAAAPAPAVEGMALRRDDVMETGADTRVLIVCGYGAQIVIAPHSRVDLGGVIAPSPSPGPVMTLLRGAAGFLMRLTDGARFAVRTPSAVAAVRSTRWALTVDAQGATAVFVAEGAVATRAAGGAATLGSGQGLDIDAAGAPGPVRRWEAERVAALAALLGPDWR